MVAAARTLGYNKVVPKEKANTKMPRAEDVPGYKEDYWRKIL